MKPDIFFRMAADLILFTHVLFAAFVISGLLLILAGRVRGWSWVRNPWFRAAHLAAIVFVVLESWAGVICPLTVWEMALRQRAGDAVYPGSFAAHWMDKLLYYNVPSWVFIVCYTAFCALVVFTWFRVRPRPFKKQRGDDDNRE